MKPFTIACNDNCSQWSARTFAQALTIKHTHLSNCENHNVRILNDEGVILNQSLKGFEEVHV